MIDLLSLILNNPSALSRHSCLLDSILETAVDSVLGFDPDPFDLVSPGLLVQGGFIALFDRVLFQRPVSLGFKA